LILDRLVVHHAEAAQEAVERLFRAVVPQGLQALEAIARLRVLVQRALDVARARPFDAILLREEIEDSHGQPAAAEHIRPAVLAPRESAWGNTPILLSRPRRRACRRTDRTDRRRRR